MSPSQMSRREVLGAGLRGTAALAALGVVGGSSLADSPASAPAPTSSPAAAPAGRALRVAHLTDVHIQPERGAGDGLTACLRHVQSLPDPPQLVLFGGDCVMDVFATDAARAKVQADLWQRVLKQECGVPSKAAIGNHDIWGWDRKASGTTGEEPTWGKRWGEDVLGLPGRYYSFDQAGWHFIVLDSTQPKGAGYTAGLDPEQMDWLKRDLAETPADRPTLVLSHIPILAAAAFMAGPVETTGDWKVPGSWMHADAREIKDLFSAHPNVKVALSGHLHLVDQVRYNAVTYCCNGAVSGAWWRGDNQECKPGYGLVDLYADGTVVNAYTTYPWTARPA